MFHLVESIHVLHVNKLLTPAQKAGIRKGLASGIGEGIMRFMFYAMNSLAYWYGVTLVLADRDKIDKEYTPAVLMIVNNIFSSQSLENIPSIDLQFFERQIN